MSDNDKLAGYEECSLKWRTQIADAFNRFVDTTKGESKVTFDTDEEALSWVLASVRVAYDKGVAAERERVVTLLSKDWETECNAVADCNLRIEGTKVRLTSLRNQRIAAETSKSALSSALERITYDEGKQERAQDSARSSEDTGCASCHLGYLRASESGWQDVSMRVVPRATSLEAGKAGTVDHSQIAYLGASERSLRKEANGLAMGLAQNVMGALHVGRVLALTVPLYTVGIVKVKLFGLHQNNDCACNKPPAKPAVVVPPQSGPFDARWVWYLKRSQYPLTLSVRPSSAKACGALVVC